MQTISATELARNTREILDKVAGSGESLAIERNQTTIAQITPFERTMTASQALDGFSWPTLTPDQADSWLKASRAEFGESVRDPWE